MKIKQKIKKLLWRISNKGFTDTLRYSVVLFLNSVSPNYRLDPRRVESRSPFRFAVFIIHDAWSAFIDRIVTTVMNTYGGRRSLNKKHLNQFSLYFLNSQYIASNSVVYSFGVGKNIDFDKAVVDRHDCTVYLFDPTPPAINFMKTQISNSRLVYTPIGLWTESRKMKFYLDRMSVGNGNLSITNFFQTQDFIEANCRTLEDIMNAHKHNRIDVLKLDIEGAALPVLEQMLLTPLRPQQIVAELEVPKRIYGASFKDIFRFFVQRQKLFKTLENNRYKILTYGKAEFLATL
jgi:FkbM family methyltransferase